MFNQRLICVVVPAFRVEKLIAKVINGLPSYIDFIVVVDDCSPDQSAQVVKELKNPKIHLVHHEKNQGVGGAMKTGFTYAIQLGADIIVKMDGDNQMDPAFLPDLLHPLAQGECDYTKGNRFSFVADNSSMPLHRKLGSQILTFLNKLASGYWHVFDPQNGYLAITSKSLRRLKLNWIDETYFFENSMLINLSMIEARVADVFVPSRYADEESSMSISWVIRSFPVKLFKGFVRRVFYRYFYRDFSPVSILLILGTALFGGGTLFGAMAWYKSVFFNEQAELGTVALGLIPIIMGFQLLVNALLLDIQLSPCGIHKFYDFSRKERAEILQMSISHDK